VNKCPYERVSTGIQHGLLIYPQYRIVPYRFPLQFLSRLRSLDAKRTVLFLPKIQKVKSANRTVFRIKSRFRRFNLFISKVGNL
jgi:hypothetical protein